MSNNPNDKQKIGSMPPPMDENKDANEEEEGLEGEGGHVTHDSDPTIKNH